MLARTAVRTAYALKMFIFFGLAIAFGVGAGKIGHNLSLDAWKLGLKVDFLAGAVFGLAFWTAWRAFKRRNMTSKIMFALAALAAVALCVMSFRQGSAPPLTQTQIRADQAAGLVLFALGVGFVFFRWETRQVKTR